MDPIVDIDQEDLVTVQHILKQRLSASTNVWVFGSRARGDAKPFSDLDLAIQATSNEAIPLDSMLSLQADFRDSDLPWKVDIVDLNAVSSEFKAIIEQDKVTLPKTT